MQSWRPSCRWRRALEMYPVTAIPALVPICNNARLCAPTSQDLTLYLIWHLENSGTCFGFMFFAVDSALIHTLCNTYNS
ncbi:hypothetical protein GDO78_008465 [Eleutherodactylus coqui]|uniref:Uncharacterized protein n=1 Tax=Eleutherodactylus coqui TaxID=57060 RepID=A0A8J6KBA0_ELECQ|nr:hypothetical protein GDO78_008465 [Eleutherodactylus coqui]